VPVVPRAPVDGSCGRRAAACATLALAAASTTATLEAFSLPRPTPSALVLPLAAPLVVLRGFYPPPADQPWLPGHRGVDLAAPAWAPVRSASAGGVGFAGPLAGRGVVVVRSGTLRWTYEPVAPLVRVGQAVEAGGLLGRLQPMLGHCRGRVCLHWGLLLGHRYLDPLARVRGGSGAVRLLPLTLAGSGNGAPLPRSGRPAVAKATVGPVPPSGTAPPPGAAVSVVGAAVGTAAAGLAGAAVRRRRSTAGRGPAP